MGVSQALRSHLMPQRRFPPLEMFIPVFQSEVMQQRVERQHEGEPPLQCNQTCTTSLQLITVTLHMPPGERRWLGRSRVEKQRGERREERGQRKAEKELLNNLTSISQSRASEGGGGAINQQSCSASNVASVLSATSGNKQQHRFFSLCSEGVH